MKRLPQTGFLLSLAVLLMTAGCLGLGRSGGPDPTAISRASTPVTVPAPAPTDVPEATATRTVTPPPTDTPEPTTARLLVWVRQEPAVINPDNQALGWDYGNDARRKESFVAWEVSEESFTSRQRYQEDEAIWYDNVVIRVSFERPPIVLNPALRYKLQATFSHSNGALNFGHEGLGERFLWHVSRGSIDPPTEFAYLPYAPNFDGMTTREWMLTVPPPSKPGDTLEMAAAMRNWPPGRVIWRYVADYH